MIVDRIANGPELLVDAEPASTPQTRISERTHGKVKQLAAESGRTFEQVIEQAIALQAIALYECEALFEAHGVMRIW